MLDLTPKLRFSSFQIWIQLKPRDVLACKYYCLSSFHSPGTFREGVSLQKRASGKKQWETRLYSLATCIHQTRRVKYDYFQPKKLVFSCIRQEDKNSLTKCLNLNFPITWLVEWPKLSRHKKTFSHIIHSLVVNSENTDKSGWHLILN